MVSEPGLAFFPEGGYPLFGLIGVVEQGNGMEPEVGKTGDMLGVGVEGAFCQGQCRWGIGQDFRAPLRNLAIEFRVWYCPVDQTHLQGLLGVVAAAQVPEFPGFFFADGAGEVGGTKPRVDGSHFGTDLAEDGTFGGDGKVTQQGEDVAAADGVASDFGNDRFGYRPNYPLEGFQRQADDAATVVGSAVGRLVAPGAEGFVAGPGQDDDADCAVPAGVIEGVDQLFAGLGAEGVVAFRAIDSDGGDAG